MENEEAIRKKWEDVSIDGSNQFNFWTPNPELNQYSKFCIKWIRKYLFSKTFQSSVSFQSDVQDFYARGFNVFKEKELNPVMTANILLELIIKVGKTINLHGPNGQTISHFLMSEWNREIAELLMLAGADFQIKDLYGVTPLDVLHDSLFHNVVWRN